MLWHSHLVYQVLAQVHLTKFSFSIVMEVYEPSLSTIGLEMITSPIKVICGSSVSPAAQRFLHYQEYLLLLWVLTVGTLDPLLPWLEILWGGFRYYREILMQTFGLILIMDTIDLSSSHCHYLLLVQVC